MVAAASALGLAMTPGIAQAGPIQPDFVAAWNGAAKSYRVGYFTRAYDAMTPLLPVGFALDDPALRVAFYRDAAAMSCTTGRAEEAAARASQAYEYIDTRAPGTFAGGPVKGGSVLFGLVGAARDIDWLAGGPLGSFQFSVPSDKSDWIATSGLRFDHNHNGRLDDVGAKPIGSGVVPGTMTENGLLVDLNLNHVNDGCKEAIAQSVKLPSAGSTLRVAKNGTVRFTISCTSAVACDGRVGISAGRRAGPELSEIAAADFYAAARRGRKLRLVLSQDGARRLRQNGGRLTSTIAALAGPTGRPTATTTVRITGSLPASYGVGTLSCRNQRSVGSTVTVIDVRGVACGTGAAVGKRWYADLTEGPGYTPGIDAPPAANFTRRVGAYRCAYVLQKPRSKGAITTCTSGRTVIRLRARLY